MSQSTEHLFDWLERAGARPRWLLRMQRHKSRPKKCYPRYARHETYMISELGAFRKGRLYLTPVKATDEYRAVEMRFKRLEEIAECLHSMGDAVAQLEKEKAELMDQVTGKTPSKS